VTPPVPEQNDIRKRIGSAGFDGAGWPRLTRVACRLTMPDESRFRRGGSPVSAA